jgi:hypothetical protein
MEGKAFSLMLAACTLLAGCSTVHTPDFCVFHNATLELGTRSSEAMDAVVQLVQSAQCEAISEDPELLGGIVLHRSGPFSMSADSTGLSAAAERGRRAMLRASASLGQYSMVLRLMAQGASSPFAGSQTVSGPVAFLVLAGRNSMDRRETASAMEAASPAIDSLALHGAGIIAAAAAIVQSSYGEMVFRRQKAFLDAPEAQAVMEVFEFNMYASELLQELETLHSAWLSIPHVNSELAQGLLDSSTPLSLAFLSGLLKGSDSGSD